MSWTADALAGAVIGIFALLCVAGVVAYRTWRRAHDVRVVLARPNVSVSLESRVGDNPGLYLVVENLGPTAASQVRLAIDPPVASMTTQYGDRVEDWFVLKQGLSTLLSGQRYAIRLADRGSRSIAYSQAVPCRARVEFDWEAAGAHHARYALELDLSALAEPRRDDELATQELARALKRLERQIKDLQSSKAMRTLARSVFKQLEPRLRAMEKQLRQISRAQPPTDKPGKNDKGAKRKRSGRESEPVQREPQPTTLALHHTHWDAADRPSSSLLG